jgi:hypothetical protein
LPLFGMAPEWDSRTCGKIHRIFGMCRESGAIKEEGRECEGFAETKQMVNIEKNQNFYAFGKSRDSYIL